MYIEKLTIENFRCFSEAEVFLNYPGGEALRGQRLPERFKNVTLFIGPNGSGKTTIFKALCLAVLSPIISNSGFRADYLVRRPAGYLGDRLPPLDETPLLSISNLVAHLKVNEIDIDIPGGLMKHPPVQKERLDVHAQITLKGDTEEIFVMHYDKNLLWYASLWGRLYENASAAFFLVAYGANRRAANPEGYTERNRSPRYQRVASVFEEYFGLVPFTVGYLELAQRGLLEEAKRILNNLLPDDVTLSEFADSENRPLFNSQGIYHPFSVLSDGYRGFISWVWDLLVQIARVLPPNSGIEALTSLSGVVIVDEIDLFLHPRWQRFLIEELADTFPNLQFLFCTHSPLVVGMLEAENLRVVNRVGDTATIEQYQEEIEGKTPNEILTSSYFGLSSTRSPRSGTLSEQMERELRLEADGVTKPSPKRRPSEVNEAQRKSLLSMVAQSRNYERALNKAEEEVQETE